MSPLFCGALRIGPLLIRYGTEEVYVKLGTWDLLYDLSLLPQIAPVTIGGLALLGCVAWWQLRKAT